MDDDLNPSAEQPDRLLGAHMPTGKGLASCLQDGKAIGCTAVQVFTSNPRQWREAPLDPEVVAAFRETRAELAIGAVISHDSYLINLAAPDPEILARSRGAFRAELLRAGALGIPWVVTHMGAHMQSGEDQGIATLVDSFRAILGEMPNDAAGIALETTAGQGTSLGYAFDHLARVIDGVGGDDRVSVCLDTCHVFAAGYDIRDEAAYGAMWADFHRTIGRDRLSVVHANDARKPLGSRVDRHEHIGRGEIGLAAFEMLVTDPALLSVPIILETPDAETMHAVNVKRLRRLAAHGGLGIGVAVEWPASDATPVPVAEEVELPIGATVGGLLDLLSERDGHLDAGRGEWRVTVNKANAARSHVLSEGDQVAVGPADAA